MIDSFLNFITYTAWGIFLLYLVFYFLRKLREGNVASAMRSLVSFPIIITFLLILSVSLLSASLVFIEPQEAGVVVSLFSRDGYRNQPFRSGLHFIVPLVEHVVLYPISWQNYTMSSEPSEGTKGNDSISSRSSDGQEVFIDSSVIFRIDPDRLIQVHIGWQNRYMEEFVRPILRSVIRTQVSQFTADEINSSKRKDLEANLDELLRDEFANQGFILDKYLLRKIAFSPQYATAVEQKQVAEQERVKTDYQAQQMRNLAQGQKDRTRIEAEGKAQARVLEMQAEATATVLKGKADADALSKIAAVLGQDKALLTYRYIEKLAPGIKAMLVPNQNPYLLPLPDLLSETPTPSGSETIISTQTITETLFLTPTPTLTSTPTPTPTRIP